jgi:hypothetical protein
MTPRKLICPYDPSLIGTFRGREIAVRVDSPSLVAKAAEAVATSQNHLICVILDTVQPIEALPLEDGWKAIPLLLMAPAVGRFRHVVKKLQALRELNIRVYLPANSHTIRDVRILSSTGIHCSIVFARSGIDWEELSDIMTYALCARVPHAPLDPFDYILRHYDPRAHLKWGRVFLDDPEHYFHLNRDGNVALSRQEAVAGRFVGCIDDFENADCPELNRRSQAWSRNFLENTVCASCEGFKLCLGKFIPEDGRADGCSTFFSEMIDILGKLRSQKETSRKENTWQL